MPPTGPLIVLVDDDPDFLAINGAVLEAGGYRVRCFCDHREALAGMADETPDLVITDLMMEALDAGFSFARELERDPRLRGVPVVVVSAIGPRRGLDFTPRDPDDLAAMHADAFVEKPVRPDKLLAVVAGVLGDGAREGGP